MSSEWEHKPQREGEIFAKDPSNKGLLFKIYKKLLKLENKKTTQLKKMSQWSFWVKEKHLSKKDIQITNKHIKKCLALLIAREM